MSRKNIRLVIEYDGTDYHGWQSQQNAKAIQDVFAEAVKQLTQELPRIIAAGRTDAGVHATGQVVNFMLEKELPIHQIRMGLNAHLPEDIVVKDVQVVDQGFNARFDAKRRVYQYYIMTEPTAVHRRYCWQLFQKFNRVILQPMAEIIIGEHDFSAFCRLETHAENNLCQVYESRWYEKDQFLIYRIVANRFLNGMVRGIVGTMVDVSRGRFGSDMFEDIFHSRNRAKAGTAAPARGLFLEQVVY